MYVSIVYSQRKTHGRSQALYCASYQTSQLPSISTGTGHITRDRSRASERRQEKSHHPLPVRSHFSPQAVLQRQAHCEWRSVCGLTRQSHCLVHQNLLLKVVQWLALPEFLQFLSRIFFQTFTIGDGRRGNCCVKQLGFLECFHAR